MSTKGDKRTFKNEDLILKVTENIDPKIWDEGKYEAFLDELCGYREYKSDAFYQHRHGSCQVRKRQPSQGH